MPYGEVSIKPTTVWPSLHARSVPNTAVSITFRAGRHVFSGLSWSYSAAPTGGRMTMGGGGFDYAWDITSGGPGFLPLYEEESDASSAITITLAAAGGVIVGELNVHGHRIGS